MSCLKSRNKLSVDKETWKISASLYFFFIEGKNVYELVQSALIFLEGESVFKSLFVAIFILD